MEACYNKKGEEVKKLELYYKKAEEKLEPLLVELKVGSLTAAERVGLVNRLKEICKILPSIKEQPVLSPKQPVLSPKQPVLSPKQARF